MGGEIAIPLLAAGLLLGLAAGAVVFLRARRIGLRRFLLAAAVFVFCLILPSAIFLIYGSYLQATSPKIEIPPNLKN
jgi:hypothetical protein